MRLKVNINQAEAIRRGIDAPKSTEMLEVDPATLSQQDRDDIAELLHDGHDLTGNAQFRLPALNGPTQSALTEALQDRRRAKQTWTEQTRSEIEELRANLTEALASEAELPYIYICSDQYFRSMFDKDLENLIDTYRKRDEKEMQSRRDADKNSEVARKERILAVVSQRNPVLVAKYRDNLASEFDIINAYEDALRDASGLPGTKETWQKSKPARTISDEAYQRLTELRNNIPEGATIKPLLVWDEEEDEDEDEDGDMVTRKINERIVYVVTWQSEKMTITTYL